MKKLLVVLLVLGFAAPAAAVQWDFGGSLRTYAGYYDVDEEYTGGPGLDDTIGVDWDDDKGFLMGLGIGSRFNAKAMVSENFYGLVELGFNNDDDTYLRLAYGVWNFGAGKLTVGQDYTPGTYLGYSNMTGDTGAAQYAMMLTDGLPYISRQPQVKLSFGDLDIALIEQNKDAEDYTDEGYGDIDFSLPRIEAAYVFRTDLVNIRPVLGFQTYEVEGPAGSADIDSYLVGIGASFDLKPAYVKATASYIQNPANYGDLNVVSVTGRQANIDANGDVNDADFYQGTLVAGVQVNKMLNLEAGLGVMDSEVDTAPGVTSEQTAYVYYLQTMLSMTKNLSIIPEIGVVDRGDLEVTGQDDVDLGKMKYANVVFRLDF